MPYIGFGQQPPTITGVEEFISLTITGEKDELLVEAGALNTAPTVVTHYNERYTASIEAISSGVSLPMTFTIGAQEFVRTSENYTRTTGDVVKVSFTGIHHPGSTAGT